MMKLPFPATSTRASTGTVKRYPPALCPAGSEAVSYRGRELCGVTPCLPMLLIFMDSARPAPCTLRALVGTDSRPRERALAGGCGCRRCDHSDVMLARDAQLMGAPPFAAALARGGGFEVVCSNARSEQKMQPRAKTLTATTNAHMNPLEMLPACSTWTRSAVVLECRGATGFPSRLSFPVISPTAFCATTRTAFSATSLKVLL
mmetsp:Transcript_83137/g.217105  ORF Transcript_83137/g.217105 Transcript_83137/m.217105 type:complete len:204 (-) Transcript_83137:249-860(-)